MEYKQVSWFTLLFMTGYVVMIFTADSKIEGALACIGVTTLYGLELIRKAIVGK